MTVADAQREVRSVFLGGAVGQIVSGAIWFLSAALGTWSGTRSGIVALVLGGPFIFPLTQLVLRLAGRPWTLSQGNPMGQLAMQVAFTIPVTLPVVGGAALHNVNWFYPACMIIVGAHYLPFIFLYGMWLYGVLAAVLVSGGLILAIALPHAFHVGGWLTGVVLVLFGLVTGRLVLRERSRPSP